MWRFRITPLPPSVITVCNKHNILVVWEGSVSELEAEAPSQRGTANGGNQKCTDSSFLADCGSLKKLDLPILIFADIDFFYLSVSC